MIKRRAALNKQSGWSLRTIGEQSSLLAAFWSAFIGDKGALINDDDDVGENVVVDEN